MSNGFTRHQKPIQAMGLDLTKTEKVRDWIRKYKLSYNERQIKSIRAIGIGKDQHYKITLNPK